VGASSGGAGRCRGPDRRAGPTTGGHGRATAVEVGAGCRGSWVHWRLVAEQSANRGGFRSRSRRGACAVAAGSGGPWRVVAAAHVLAAPQGQAAGCGGRPQRQTHAGAGAAVGGMAAAAGGWGGALRHPGTEPAAATDDAARLGPAAGPAAAPDPQRGRALGLSDRAVIPAQRGGVDARQRADAVSVAAAGPYAGHAADAVVAYPACTARCVRPRARRTAAHPCLVRHALGGLCRPSGRRHRQRHGQRVAVVDAGFGHAGQQLRGARHLRRKQDPAGLAAGAARRTDRVATGRAARDLAGAGRGLPPDVRCCSSAGSSSRSRPFASIARRRPC
jgi:hypothetical protein